MERPGRWIRVGPDRSVAYPATLASLNVSLGAVCLTVGTPLVGVLLLGLAGLVLATLLVPPSTCDRPSAPR